MTAVKNGAIRPIDDIDRHPARAAADRSGCQLLVAAIHPDDARAVAGCRVRPGRRPWRRRGRGRSSPPDARRAGRLARAPRPAGRARASSGSSRSSARSPGRRPSGRVAIAPGDTLAILAHRLFGLDCRRDLDRRRPRRSSWTCGCRGSSPRWSSGSGWPSPGATFQGLLRNPLADPYVLGTASGAALGAAIAVLLPVRIVVLEFGLLHGLAFVGALARRRSPSTACRGSAASRR